MEKQTKDDEHTYTIVSHATCPKDSSKAAHTVTYKKATCTRVDDIILNFCCSRVDKCQSSFGGFISRATEY